MNETTIWHALARDPLYCVPIYFSFCLRAVKTIQWSACQRVPTTQHRISPRPRLRNTSG